MTLVLREGTMADRAIEQAAAMLRAGGLVAFPTETVYGLGADASNALAVDRIFAAKGRPRNHPLIVHLATAEVVGGWVRSLSPAAELLAATCWPGPLTLLAHRGPSVLDAVTGGRDTVGLRVPSHPVATALLQTFDRGVAAPSANRFGHVSPTSAEHVVADLGGVVDIVIDGGAPSVGVESTIVDCSVDPPQVLRPGGIPTEDIIRLLDGRVSEPTGPSRASGMLASHYAPNAQIVLFEDPELARASARTSDAVLIGDGVDVVDYARHLYTWLRQADADMVPRVIAVLPPAVGLGHAVRDRLTKAAAAR